MMDIEFVNKFKVELLHMLAEAKEDKKRYSEHPVAQAVVNTKIEMLEYFVIFVTKSLREGVVDMDKLKSEIKVVGEGDIEELKAGGRANSPVTSAIIQIAEECEEGKYKEVSAQGVEWSHFSTRVHQLRAAKRIPNNVYPATKNGKFYLQKYTPAQMDKYVQKRKSKVSAN